MSYSPEKHRAYYKLYYQNPERRAANLELQKKIYWRKKIIALINGTKEDNNLLKILSVDELKELYCMKKHGLKSGG